MANKKATKIYHIDELPDILTLQEASCLLGFDAETLRQKSVAGQFPGFQLFENDKRGSWRVMKEDMVNWLNARRNKANQRRTTR